MADRWGLVPGVAGIVTGTLFAQNDTKKPTIEETQPTDQETRVARLIEQLGAGEFTAGKRPRRTWRKLGWKRSMP